MGSNPDQEKFDDLSARIRDASAKPTPEKGESTGQMPASRLGFDFAGAVIGSIILGVVIDHVFGTKPWGVLIMVVVGFTIGMMNMWRAMTINDKTASDKVETTDKTDT